MLDAAGEADANRLVELVCECGDLACREVVSLPVSSFDRRSEPGAVVAHGVESARGGGT